MKKSFGCALIALALGATYIAGTASADGLGKCVSYQFNGSKPAALQINNGCDQAVNVIALGSDGSPLGEVSDLQPGEIRNAGSVRADFKEAGGVVLAACQSNQSIVDVSGKRWNGPANEYKCISAGTVQASTQP